MTEKANPSINRPAEAFKTAGAIAYGGHGGGGFVVDGANPTDISVQDGGITEANFNAFAETSSGSSFDVTIDGGEAFVFGSWLAIDTDTTVTLASSTTGQTVYVGWNKNGADDVIVGLDSAFSSASGDTDERIPLWKFDTDGSGVTGVTDKRQIGKLNTGGVDLQGGQLRDSAQSYVDLSGGGNNLRFATGGALEDESGTKRLRIESDRTRYNFPNGDVGIKAQSNVGVEIRAQAGKPWTVRDDEQADTGVQYDTGASAGLLRTPNSGARIESNGTPSSGEGLEIRYDVSKGSAFLTSFDRSNSVRKDIELFGRNIELDANGGLINMAESSADLRLATGKVIEDGSGRTRLLLGGSSNGTRIMDDNGSIAAIYEDGAGYVNYARANESWRIDDQEGEFNAISYTTSSPAPGTLKLTESKLQLYKTTSDPAASPGEMWYREDLD